MRRFFGQVKPFAAAVWNAVRRCEAAIDHRAGASRQQRPDHRPVDVSQSEVASLEAVGEAFVVEAEQVEDGRLEVVDVDLVGGDMEAEVVGGAVAEPGFDAAADC
jgi:hypothetical protein